MRLLWFEFFWFWTEIEVYIIGIWTVDYISVILNGQNGFPFWIDDWWISLD
jgi:hypothetical protein